MNQENKRDKEKTHRVRGARGYSNKHLTGLGDDEILAVSVLRFHQASTRFLAPCVGSQVACERKVGRRGGGEGGGGGVGVL